jgi:hypothetical protein
VIGFWSFDGSSRAGLEGNMPGKFTSDSWTFLDGTNENPSENEADIQPFSQESTDGSLDGTGSILDDQAALNLHRNLTRRWMMVGE